MLSSDSNICAISFLLVSVKTSYGLSIKTANNFFWGLSRAESYTYCLMVSKF